MTRDGDDGDDPGAAARSARHAGPGPAPGYGDRRLHRITPSGAAACEAADTARRGAWLAGLPTLVHTVWCPTCWRPR